MLFCTLTICNNSYAVAGTVSSGRLIARIPTNNFMLRQGIPITMSSSTSNIEAVARDICPRQLSAVVCLVLHSLATLTATGAVSLLNWKAGPIGDDGNPMPNISLDKGLDAYRDWRRRHPESCPPHTAM